MPSHHPITPLPIPLGTRRVLLVGGTFDPPHTAHAQMAIAARQWLDSRDSTRGTTSIFFVPAARSPFKPPPIAGDAARVEMVRAMAADIPISAVWIDEIDRAAAAPNQPSYWIDTLERARVAIAVGGADPSTAPVLTFLIGADQAISLHRWKHARRLIELAAPVIVLRPPIATSAPLQTSLHEAAFWSPAEIESLLARIAPAELSRVNATAIRAALVAGQPPPPDSLSPRVLAIIKTRGLYAKQ